MPDTDVLEVTISNRVIKFHKPTDGQEMMIARATGAIHRGSTSALMGISMILDVIEALLADEADKQFLADSMINGEIGIKDLTPLLEAINVAMGDAAPTTGPAPRARANGRR